MEDSFFNTKYFLIITMSQFAAACLTASYLAGEDGDSLKPYKIFKDWVLTWATKNYHIIIAVIAYYILAPILFVISLIAWLTEPISNKNQ